jgi:hypothetical protein
VSSFETKTTGVFLCLSSKWNNEWIRQQDNERTFIQALNQLLLCITARKKNYSKSLYWLKYRSSIKLIWATHNLISFIWFSTNTTGHWYKFVLKTVVIFHLFYVLVGKIWNANPFSQNYFAHLRSKTPLVIFQMETWLYFWCSLKL